MKTKPINVFIIDDEFPQTDGFREKGIYNSAITKNNLFHLVVNSDWHHLIDLQQLIKEIIASQACEEGLIDIFGFSSPTQALTAIENNLIPDIVVYDWEYMNAPAYSSYATSWLKYLLEKTGAFIFIYTKRAEEIQKIVLDEVTDKFIDRVQLFMKAYKVQSSFSSEEFILQYVIGAATNSGNIRIDGIPIKFTSNDYLVKASDILFLQRILGGQYVVNEMQNLDFTINQASVEKLLNDSKLFLLANRVKKYLIIPDHPLLNEKGINNLEKITYLEVIKQFSKEQLENTLERGILYY